MGELNRVETVGQGVSGSDGKKVRMFSDKEYNEKITEMVHMALEMVTKECRTEWAARIMSVPVEEANEQTVKQAEERMRSSSEPFEFFKGLHAVATGKQFCGLAQV
jgi:hypothetical protein